MKKIIKGWLVRLARWTLRKLDPAPTVTYRGVGVAPERLADVDGFVNGVGVCFVRGQVVRIVVPCRVVRVAAGSRLTFPDRAEIVLAPLEVEDDLSTKVGPDRERVCVRLVRYAAEEDVPGGYVGEYEEVE